MQVVYPAVVIDGTDVCAPFPTESSPVSESPRAARATRAPANNLTIDAHHCAIDPSWRSNSLISRQSDHSRSLQQQHGAFRTRFNMALAPRFAGQKLASSSIHPKAVHTLELCMSNYRHVHAHTHADRSTGQTWTMCAPSARSFSRPFIHPLSGTPSFPNIATA